MKKPIAMRCTQEHFEAVKSKLEGMHLIELDPFSRHEYLVNFFRSEPNDISNLNKSSVKNSNTDFEIHETWNEKIFLEACGIIPTFQITKEQLQTITPELAKQWFPSAFEKELEVGKWYKAINLQSGCLGFEGLGMSTDEEIGSGFILDVDSNVKALKSVNGRVWGVLAAEFVEATEQEVFEALKKEAIKRGYKEGLYIVDMYNGVSKNDSIQISSDKLDWEKIRAGKNFGDMALRDSDGNIIFHDGKWATIIPTITKQEAEVLLNKKIV